MQKKTVLEFKNEKNFLIYNVVDSHYFVLQYYDESASRSHVESYSVLFYNDVFFNIIRSIAGGIDAIAEDDAFVVVKI